MKQEEKLDHLTENIEAILETVNFIKETAATKNQLSKVEYELREEIQSLKTIVGAQQQQITELEGQA